MKVSVMELRDTKYIYRPQIAASDEPVHLRRAFQQDRLAAIHVHYSL